MSTIPSVDDSSFADEVEVYEGPVLVDFWAEWCGPCKQLAPRLEALSEEYPDVKFVKVDVDDNQSLAQSFGVRSIPTLIFYEDGEVQEQVTGALSIQTLREKIEKTFSVAQSAA